MDGIRTMLCDGREDVKNALAAIEAEFPFTLRSGFARRETEGDSITWGEWSNTGTDCPVVDELCYAVTVRCTDLDKLRTLCAGVNEALVGLGLKRCYTSPDEFDEYRYTKTLRFGRKVDKRMMRLID